MTGFVFQVGEVREAPIPHGRPQDGAGRGHPDGVLLGADRAVRREAVAGDGVPAGPLEVGIHHHYRARASSAKVSVNDEREKDTNTQRSIKVSKIYYDTNLVFISLYAEKYGLNHLNMF